MDPGKLEWLTQQWNSLVTELYNSADKDSLLDRGKTRSSIRIKGVDYNIEQLKEAQIALRNELGSCVPPTLGETGVSVDEFVRSHVVPHPEVVPLYIDDNGTVRRLTSAEIYTYLSGVSVREGEVPPDYGLRKQGEIPFSIPELLAVYYLFWELNCGGKARGGSRHKTRKVHKQLQRRSSSKRVRRRRRSTRRRN